MAGSAPRIDAIESNTQPATPTTAGVVKLIKYQRKELAQNINATGLLSAIDSNFKFAALEIGKLYQLQVNFTATIANATVNQKQISWKVVHGGGDIGGGNENCNAISEFGSNMVFDKIFVATGTTIEINLIVRVNADIPPFTATSNNNSMTLYELSSYVATTEWT